MSSIVEMITDGNGNALQSEQEACNERVRRGVFDVGGCTSDERANVQRAQALLDGARSTGLSWPQLRTICQLAADAANYKCSIIESEAEGTAAAEEAVRGDMLVEALRLRSESRHPSGDLLAISWPGQRNTAAPRDGVAEIDCRDLPFAMLDTASEHEIASLSRRLAEKILGALRAAGIGDHAAALALLVAATTKHTTARRAAVELGGKDLEVFDANMQRTSEKIRQACREVARLENCEDALPPGI